MTDIELKPNKEQMLAHVQHIFGDCMRDGLIELAWTGPLEKDRKIRYCRMFDVTELSELVEEAFKINSFKGQNVYIGAGVRHPETEDGLRTEDSDVIYMPALYVDLDNAGVAEAVPQIYQHLKPTLIVTTGQIPHLRQQLWWKLDQPVTELSKSTAQIKAITDTLNGDPTIHNPSRVMRLAGSVAWPKKPGRVAEMTSLEPGANYQFAIEDFVGVFSIKAEPEQRTAERKKDATTLNLPEPAGLRVKECLDDLNKPSRWHQNVLRLTGHWIRNGLSDLEIMLFAPGLTQDGYSVRETRRDLQSMLSGAREKWDIPDPDAFLPDATEATPLFANFIDKLIVSMIPRRMWILGRTLLKGYLSVLVAPPGVGKSTLCIAQAVSIITGKPIAGEDVHIRGKVWIYNNEDDNDELKRRLAAVLQHHNISFDEIAGQLALNSGADRPLLVARTLSDGTVIRLPDVEECIEHIKKHNIIAFIVDPFIETHECEENSNQQIKRVGQMFRDIARRADCAVELVHHTGKPPQGSSDGHAGNMWSARGASALVGVARIIKTLFGMSKKDAERRGVREDDRHLYIRLDDAKANLSLASPEAKWFKRLGVTLVNTDEVGVLEPITLDENAALSAGGDPDSHHAIIAALLAQVMEEVITLNRAVNRLAWGGNPAFEKYRIIDDQGRQRASTSLRTKVKAACRSPVVVVIGSEACGFTLDDSKSPHLLRRFSRPVGAAELASQPPENFTDMEEEDDF